MLEPIFDILVGTGVATSLFAYFWQSRRAQEQEDERMLAQARVLLARLINLQPNDPFSAIQGGDPHDVAQSEANWKRDILNTRIELENTALSIRTKKLRRLAAKLLEVAEPPLGEWNEDLAMWLIGETKIILGPKIVDARKDPHRLIDDEQDQ